MNSPDLFLKLPRARILYILILSVTIVFLITVLWTRSIPSPYYSMLHTKSPPADIELAFETVDVPQVAQRHHEDPDFEPRMRSLVTILVTNYIAWHTQQQQRLAEDPAYARSLSVLVFRGDSNYGIGDRMRGLVHSYLGAVVSNRYFLIDLPKPWPLATMLDSPDGRNFTYDQSAFLKAGCEETRLSKMILYSNISPYLSFSDQLLVDETTPVLDWEKFLLIPERYPLLPFSRDIAAANLTNFSPTRLEIVPFIFQALFRLSPLLRSHLFDRKVPYRYISIHARFGEGLGEKTARFDFNTYSLTMRSTARCLAILAHEQFEAAKKLPSERKYQDGMEFPEDGAFFVAADTPEGKAMIEEELHAIRSGAHVLSGDWAAVHTRSLGGDSSKREEQFLQTWLDLVLLAGGEDIVYIRSGFAHVSLWMGAIRNPLGLQLRHCQQLVVQNDTAANVTKTARDEQAGYYLERMGPKAYKDTGVATT